MFSQNKTIQTPSGSGFTLVELLVGMGLMSVFMMLLTNLFVTILQVKLEAESTTAIQQDSTYLFSRLTYDIARAQTISTPTTIGGSGTILVLSIDGNPYTYTTDGTALTLTNAIGTHALNSSETKVTTILFTRLGNMSSPSSKDTIQISATFESSTKRNKGAETQTFTTIVGRRQ